MLYAMVSQLLLRQLDNHQRLPAEEAIKAIRRATRRHFSAEDKIRIVLEGLRGENSIAELRRREGIVQNLHYRWSKDFLEAGKKRLARTANRKSRMSSKIRSGAKPPFALNCRPA